MWSLLSWLNSQQAWTTVLIPNDNKCWDYPYVRYIYKRPPPPPLKRDSGLLGWKGAVLKYCYQFYTLTTEGFLVWSCLGVDIEYYVSVKFVVKAPLFFHGVLTQIMP